jgi:hypothetical protein
MPDTLSITRTVWNRADRPAWADIRTFTCRSAPSLHRPPLTIVVLADDNFLVREGVAALLAEAPEITVVASVGDADELLEAVARLRPDAGLTDIRMPPSFTTEPHDHCPHRQEDQPGDPGTYSPKYR